MIVPCFNDGATLCEAIDSVREQEPVEIVVVNDGSTDASTLAVLKSLAERPNVAVIDQPNGGIGAARARGLSESSGTFVLPLDADDELLPGTLGVMADTIEHHHEAAFCWGDYELFGAEDGFYRSPRTWLPWTLTWVNPYPVSALFRRSVLDATGGWSESLRSYEDWDLWLRLADHGYRGVNAGRAVYKRRIHGDTRLLPQARREHSQLYAELKKRNRSLYQRRRDLRRDEKPAAWKPVVFPILFGARKIVPLRAENALKRAMMKRGAGLP